MQYTWTFPQFIVDPVYDGLQNVATAINWVCTGNDGYVSSSNSGTIKLGTPNPAKFVPYDKITQEMAMQWVSERISVSNVQDMIALQIAEISKPPLQPQSPPF
jgi:hypothetical protein